MFAHLHCHSNYSLLRGACTVDELAAAAKARGMDALAVTDTNGLYGAVPFYRACLKHSVKPIFGTEIVCPPEPAHPEGSRAIILARNRAGYSELCRIITRRHLEHDFDLTKTLREASGDVVVLADDPQLLLRLRERGHQAHMYLELHPAEDRQSAQKRDSLARWAEENRIPLVATNNVHFVSPHQRQLHQVLRAIDANTSIESIPPEESAGTDCWLKPPCRMQHDLGEWQIALDNAAAIADDCRVELELGKMRFPRFPAPPGVKAADLLRKITYECTEQKYGTLASVVRSRVDRELDVIISMGYSDYFLIVYDIAEEAKRRGIPTVGRGSAADSIVSYVLDITRVDPIDHNLYFERFLNPERKDPPDIDLDFCWRRRDEMLAYMFEKYGEDRVAMICTHNTFGSRSAIREVARALGLSPAEVNRVSARLPYGNVSDVERVVANNPEYADLPIHTEPLKSIIAVARQIDGFPRHLSIHAGGLVIAPDTLTEFVPLQYASKGIIITQYDMHPIEDLGLVKMDLLGQRSLSVIADTVEAVRRQHGIEIDLGAIPQDDEPTKHLLRTGATIGCFQIESPGMRQLLQKLKADNLEILIAASSVIRPGPADSGMMTAFIRRYLGKEPISYLHPKLEPLLHETFGVMLYQEDILKVASVIGGMTLGEADNLRRSMSKKRGYEGIAHERDRFLRGAADNGISPDIAEQIWAQIESFAGYAFCKAHSASYAMLSWQAAYLKANYPAQFMAAVLSNHGGFYSAWVYVEEARRMGLRILPPDVNTAQPEFTGEDGAVRIGLAQVKSLAKHAMQSIIEQRRIRPFDSLSDFVARTAMSLSEYENLIECGAMDSFAGNRPQKAWMLQMNYPAVKKRKAAVPAGELFQNEEAAGESVPEIQDYDMHERLEYERRVLDCCVTSHPMILFKDRYASNEWLPVSEAVKNIGRRVTMAGVVITAKGTTTSKNERMKFISLEDHTGIIEVVLFPDAYHRSARHLTSAAMIARGYLASDEGSITLEADSVRPLE